LRQPTPASRATGLSQVPQWLRLMGKNGATRIGTVIVIVFLLAAVLAPFLTRYDPLQPNLDEVFQRPSLQHPFGTDEMGRDVLTRVLYGARVSLQVVVVTLAVACGIGVVVGAISGYAGGMVDEVIMRVTDMFLAFPALILTMAVGAALGPSIQHAMLAVGIVWWPLYARLIRGQVLALKEEEFVEASRSAGANPAWVIFRHILPNTLTALMVQMTMDVGQVILTTAGLSFVGVGAQPPLPEWGLMVSTGRVYLEHQWWVGLFPGLAIFIVALGFNLAGDGLRDALDPERR